VVRRASVRVEPLTLPAYSFCEDPFPPLQRRHTRRVYPYPMQDDPTDEVTDREFTAIVLENGLLRVTVLPELGGHIISARDLVHGRELFYPNVPLKFGLIALRGAWWAGGIEWNFPQIGHSVSTSDTVPWHVREDEDGSATAFVGAVEHLTRMAWTVAVALHPDDWRIHVRIRLFNRTPFYHRTYFWSNAAVPARPDFRLLLPVTETYSFWYGESGASPFPIDKGRDKSRLATFEGSADTFAKDLRADWFGGYYDELDYGVIHHASRFDVPGRKLFTWGTGEDGKVWAELLNARGEPYVEIQSGRFVHQGIHRLAPPYSVETWDETWSPVWSLGGVVHATDELALNATREGDTLALRLLALKPIARTTLRLRQDGKAIEETELSFGAGETKALTVALRGGAPVALELGDGQAVTLRVDGEAVRPALDAVAPHVGVREGAPEGEPTTPHGWLLKARDHEERSDLAAAADACRRALELDPACAAAMAGLAQWHLKRSETAAAREWARKALRADPQAEDALWWLGVAHALDAGEPGEAAACLRALERSPRYDASAHVLLGEMALRRGEPAAALRLFARALERSSHDCRLWALAAFAARRAGDPETALLFLEQCERENPLEPLLWSERFFLQGPASPTPDALPRDGHAVDPDVLLEAACDYERVGAWETAAEWLAAIGSDRPVALYHIAATLRRLGEDAEAMRRSREASRLSPLFVFPHRHEDGRALEEALRASPDDALARHLRATWLASVGRWEEALEHWTRTTQLVDAGELAVLAWRNVALAHWHHRHDADAALAAYARAIEALAPLAHAPSLDPRPSTLAPSSWRLWLERDTILADQERHDERLSLFDSAPDDVKAKWQVQARRAEASLRAQKPEQALHLLSQCEFKPWEGESRPRRLWKEAHMQLGHQAREAGDLARAREHFEAAAAYPRRLGVGKPARTDDADALFHAGSCALESGDREAARRLLTQAAEERQSRRAGSTEFKARAAELLKTLPA